ncbi:MAG: HAD family hydrolase [Candidatus Desulfatibia sp.]|jgi:phosphoglycolate phosphatase|uniref:HAD family hydrolase n=1 Tax=Candidatus Desulfatibia sp. TaxID=3101189 RepID=UPI002F2D8BFA
MKYEAVLFDLDGTLIDTVDDIGDAANRVLSNRGFPIHPISTYYQFIGEGVKVLFTRALPQEKRNEDLINTCLKEFVEDYRRNYDVKSKPYDGIPEMLNALNARGLKLAILSNKPDPLTKDCVTSLLSNWDFGVVFGQRDSVPRKPSPQAALEIAEKLSISPSDFLYLGDTAIDMKTAVSAGMFPVGVAWGFRPVKELKENGAHVIIDKPIQLLDLIKV